MVLRPWDRKARLLAGSPATTAILAPRDAARFPFVPLFAPRVLTGLGPDEALGVIAGSIPGAS
jgi:hypothetical protein